MEQIQKVDLIITYTSGTVKKFVKSLDDLYKEPNRVLLNYICKQKGN
jgi:hypothetical protein